MISCLDKFLETEQNKSFSSKILRTDRKRFNAILNFDSKTLHSIFFGTKAAKRKLPILKERWFDIASEK
jgi:hypothetical protein